MEKSFGLRTYPTLINNSLSASSITVGNSVTIYLNTQCTQTSGFDDCSVTSATVQISRPDATTANWTMTHDSGTLWYKTYTSTSDVGTYTIDNYYVTDDSEVTGTDSSNLTFTASSASTGGSSGGGGGGGGSSVTTIEKPNIDWKLTPNKIDMPVIIYGKKSAIWSQSITSNIDLFEVKSNFFTAKIDDSKTNLIIFYNITESENIHEIIKIRNKYGEVKDTDVSLTIYNLGGIIKIYPIPIPNALSGLLSWFFAVENGKIVGVYILTVVSVSGFFILLLLYYFAKERQWFYGKELVKGFG